MNKPKDYKNWVIATSPDSALDKLIYYGSFDELIKEYEGKWVEIPFENWTPEDVVKIFEEDLENNNDHSWIWLPEKLNNEMIRNKIPERERFNIISQMHHDWYYYW